MDFAKILELHPVDIKTYRLGETSLLQGVCQVYEVYQPNTERACP